MTVVSQLHGAKWPGFYCVDDKDNEIGGGCGEKDNNEHSLLILYRDHSNIE